MGKNGTSATIELPYPENDARTHWGECWMHRGHHNCAVARVRELEGERESLIHDLERHIAIAAQEADARLKAEAELESREPSKSQIKRISAMVESAEIKRLEAEVGRLRDFVLEFSEEPCAYGDDCSDEATRQHRHYRCVPCKARAALKP